MTLKRPFQDRVRCLTLYTVYCLKCLKMSASQCCVLLLLPPFWLDNQNALLAVRVQKSTQRGEKGHYTKVSFCLIELLTHLQEFHNSGFHGWNAVSEATSDGSIRKIKALCTQRPTAFYFFLLLKPMKTIYHRLKGLVNPIKQLLSAFNGPWPCFKLLQDPGRSIRFMMCQTKYCSN